MTAPVPHGLRFPRATGRFLRTRTPGRRRIGPAGAWVRVPRC